MDGFEAPCDRCLFVFWGRSFDIAKGILEGVEEEKLRIPALRGARSRYGGVEIYVYRLCISAPVVTIAMEILIASGVKKFLVFGGCGAMHPSGRIYDIVVLT